MKKDNKCGANGTNTGNPPYIRNYKTEVNKNNLKFEIWKNYPEISGLKASNLGRFKMNGELMKLWFPESGYASVKFQSNDKHELYLAHRIVAELFVNNRHDLPINELYVHHRDLDLSNCAATNLVWLTASENVLHAYMFEEHGRAITFTVIFERTGNSEVFYAIREASRELGISITKLNQLRAEARANNTLYDGKGGETITLPQRCLITGNFHKIVVFDERDQLFSRYSSVKLARIWLKIGQRSWNRFQKKTKKLDPIMNEYGKRVDVIIPKDYKLISN